MKYIAYWEYDPKDTSKVIDKIKKRKGSYTIETLFPSHYLIGRTKGFTIFEAEDEMEIVKFSSYYAPEAKMEIFPIVETSKVTGPIE